MAGLPTVQVLLDDVSNGGTWPYDITAYFALPEGFAITRGRTDELSQIQPGSLTITLDNTDGRFTLGTSGGGYGAINVDRGIRVKLIANSVTTTRFTGFVQAWPVNWPSGSDQFALVQVTAVDAMARWSRRVLRSVIEEEFLLDKPAAYFTMGDPAQPVLRQNTPVAQDSSGNGASPMLLTYTNADVAAANPVFASAAGPTTDGLTAVVMPGNAKYLMSASTNVPTGPTWLECTFSVSVLPTFDSRIAFVYGANYFLDISVDQTGHLKMSSPLGGALITGPSVCDGATHHAAAVYDSSANLYRLYLDGTQVSTATFITGGPYSYVSIGQAYVGCYAYSSTVVAHVALGAGTPPSAARFAAHANAALNGFNAETTDARFARLATYEGSATTTSLDAGQTRVPFIDFTGATVADSIQLVEDAEQGIAYIDGQGRATFHNRTRSPLKTTADLTLSVTNDVVAEDVSVSADMQQVINYATGNRDGDTTSVTQVAANASSQALHGRYPQAYSFLVSTDLEVFARINWQVNTHCQPIARIPQLTLDLLSASATDQAAVMALDFDSRVQVTNLPMQSPTGTTADLSVLGWTETLAVDTWTWSANTASWAAYEQAWILADSTYGVLGTSTRLAV